MSEIIVKDLGELKIAAQMVLERAGGPKTIALSGDLGAGKTALTQAVCRILGVGQNVTSPTFSLVNEYTYTDEKGREQLFLHLDLYRLKSIEEALGIGIEDYLHSPSYCFIEWPEIIHPLLPPDTIHINISILRDSSRKILIL